MGALILGDVLGGIVLGVTTAAKSFGFDQYRAFTRASALYGFLRGGVDGHDIVPVDNVAGNAIRLGAVGEIFERDLATHGSGVSPKIIFENKNERGFLRRGEIQAFVKNSSRTTSITNPGHGDDFLADIAAGHGHASHNRNEIAEHGDGRDNVKI